MADLSNAEEVSHLVRVRENSHLARRPLSDLELPVQCGMRVVAIRRGREWITDVDGDSLLDAGRRRVFLTGLAGRHRPAAGATAALRGSRRRRPRTGRSTDLDRAVDVLVQMKNFSEAAVGLSAYSALRAA